jgi:hypothetical protein
MHRKRQNKKVKAVALVASAAAVAGLTVYGTSSALAGTNGQMIRLCTRSFDRASLFGFNQNGEPTLHNLSLSGGQGCTLVDGFFWKGDVIIQWAGGPRLNREEDTRCFVPETLPEEAVICSSS